MAPPSLTDQWWEKVKAKGESVDSLTKSLGALDISSWGTTSVLTKETALEEFTLFPQLPPELRIKIWERALPIFNIDIKHPYASILATWPGRSDGEFVPVIGNELILGRSWFDRESEEKYNVVTLLTTCIEARRITRKAFPHKLPFQKWGCLYFNDNSIIHVSTASIVRLLCHLSQALRRGAKVPAGFENIKHLSLDGSMFFHFRNDDIILGELASVLRAFKNLKTLVVWNGEDRREGFNLVQHTDALSHLLSSSGADPSYKAPRIEINLEERGCVVRLFGNNRVDRKHA